MNGALLDQARDMNQKIINKGGFQTDITFTTDYNGGNSVTISGTARLHSTTIDPETLLETVGRVSSVLVSANDLIEDSYEIYRDASNPSQIILKDDIVEFVDAQGKAQKFEAAEVRPSLTFGCITIILKDRE